MRLVSPRTRGPVLCGLVIAALGAISVPEDPEGRTAIPIGSGGIEGPVWVEREVRAMGTRLRFRVQAADRPAGIRATEAALESVRATEGLLSTWQPDTELSRLNRAPAGTTVGLSARLGPVLKEARAWARETNGAFEPAVGALIEVWGLRDGGHRPSDQAVAEGLAATGVEAVSVQTDKGSAIRHHPSAWIDSGGFGKGFALRSARRALVEAGVENAVLDFGGQLLTLGRPAPGGADTSWRISVAHPERRRESGVTLAVGEVSVSTTSGSERFVTPEEHVLSHVVDPRSGRPVRPWGSVTVVAEDPMVADVVSTALFVMGPDEGLAWARDRRDLAILIMEIVHGPADEEGGRDSRVRARWNPVMEGLLDDVPEKAGNAGEGGERVDNSPDVGTRPTAHEVSMGVLSGIPSPQVDRP